MSLIESAEVSCPYCGEAIELVIDCSAGSQECIEDCQVCCKPILVSVSIGDNGEVDVSVSAEQSSS